MVAQRPGPKGGPLPPSEVSYAVAADAAGEPAGDATRPRPRDRRKESFNAWTDKIFSLIEERD